jgi:SAM-dependent methyltransferase
MGWQAEGVEISNALRDTQLGGNIRLHIGEFPNVDLEPGFDLVTAFHVLEHLPDFKAAMDRIEELVPTRGHFIFEVPNAGSAVHRLTGHEWFGRDYPHHIYQFTCKSLREALEKRGWTHLRTRQWSLEFGPYSVGQSLANALFPRWHNAFYECLQTPQRSPALLFRAALQFPVVIAGAIVYPAIHAATWASESSEIVRMHFQKR